MEKIYKRGSKESYERMVKQIKLKNGDNFFSIIGHAGGKAGHTGGFAANRELARIAGAKGGRIGRRGPAKSKTN